MKTKTTWTKNKVALQGECGGNFLTMDGKSPLGEEKGMTPKELVALGISGCTAMDVLSLLKKYKQVPDAFVIESEVVQTESGKYPVIFKEVLLTFQVSGSVEKDKLIEAVHLSQTKFCGVSAMINVVAPISYKVFLNGELINEGRAEFQISL